MGEPENRSSQVLAVAILFLTLTWITIILRIYVRVFMIKSFGRDDWAMCGVLALFTAYTACQLGGVAHGTGQHRSALTDENAQVALRYWFFCEVFYSLATSFLKVAIGLFLLRITIERVHTFIVWFIMAFSAVCGVAYCMIVLFQCKPISFWWDLNPSHTGTCLSPLLIADTTYTVSALNSVADWAFAILPIFIVKDLQMKGKTKAVVAMILGLAAIASTATIIRMPFIWTVKEYKGDFLYRTTDVAIWSTVEVGIGITAGNIATLRPMFQRFLAAAGMQPTSNPHSQPRWTSNRKSGASKIGYLRSQPLDDLRPDGEVSKTITTVTAKASANGLVSWADKSRGSEDDILPVMPTADFVEVRGTGGISKSVLVTTVEERSNSNKTPPSDEESGLSNPALIYERV
ncbi:hypothetical protein MBLNU459_g2287t1 [Dothideomycetes sp. NU459]